MVKKRQIFKALALIFLTVAAATSMRAQFVEERAYVGPTIGLGIGGGLAYGLNGEYAMTENFGLIAGLGLSGFTEDFGGLGLTGSVPTIDYSLLMGYVGASYHFMPKKKFDPYLSLGIAYFKWDVKYRTADGEETDPFQGFSSAYTSGIGFTGQIGARYHFSDVVSARVTLGYPMWVGLGVDVAFGGVTPTAAESTSSPTPASSDTSATLAAKKKYKLFVGPYIAGKASIKTDVGEGMKTGVVFNVPPDFGVSITAPFGAESNIGFGLQAGYATYGYQMKPESQANDSNTVNEMYSFINMFPHFNIGGFIIGVNFGFPSSGSTRTIKGDSVSMFGSFSADTASNGDVTYEFNRDPVGPTYDPAKYLSTMVEFRIGGSIPIVSSDFGKLKINIMAGYTLNQLFETAGNYIGSYDIDGTDLETLRLDEGLNPRIPSLSIGIQYDFAIGL